MNSNFLRSCRAGRVTQEAIDKCFQERGHEISSVRDECWFCGYKFPLDEALNRRDVDRRKNLKRVRD